MQEDRIIIEVEVNAGKSAEQLANVKKRIADIKAEQKQMNAAVKESGTVTAEQAKRMAELQGELKKLTAEEKMYTNQIQLATQNDKAYGDSITELGAQLAALKAEYRALSKEQRESAEGKDMLKSIQQLDTQVKNLNYDLGDHQANVGNYASALLGLNGNVLKVAQLFQGGFRNGITAATKALRQFAKTLLTTPLGWIMAGVAALVAVFKQLRAAFGRNDEAGTALSVALAKLQPIVTALRKVFEGLATAVASVVGAITGAASAIIGFLVPSFKEASKAAQQLETDQDRLEEKQREYTVAAAQRERDIAALRKEAADTERYTAAERAKMYQQIDDLEKKDLEEKRAIAKENLRIIEERYKRESDSSDAAKDAIAKARADVLKAETEYLNGTVRIASRAAQARKQEAEEEKRQAEERRRRWEELKKARQEAAKTELDELRKLEDMTFALIADLTQRSIAETTARYEREIADLKTRLQTEKNLTIAARQAINQQILLLEKQKTADLDAIRKQADEQAVKDAIEAQEKALKAQEEAIKEQQKLVQLQYSNLAKQYANDLERSMQAAGDNVQKQAEANMAYAEQQLDMLRNMDAATRAVLFDTVADYEAAVLTAEAAITSARKEGYEAFKKQTEEIAATMQSVTGALSDLFEAAAGDSVAYEKFKKAMAIVDAMISMATTIASATAASTAGDPYTMAIRIAANVAAVTAQFAAVIKAIKAASVPSAPTFAQGGIVPGSSYTGDNVAVKTNSREMILTMEQQKHLFDLIAAGMPAMGINYERMAAAISRGFEQAPAPILEYREFVRFSNRAKTINYNM